MVCLVDGIFRKKADLVSKGRRLYINGTSQFRLQQQNAVDLQMHGAACKIGHGGAEVFPFGVVALFQPKAVINLWYQFGSQFVDVCVL